MKSRNIKIVDFGTACELPRHKKLTQTVGTLNYIAPDIFKKRYNEKCDMWSCGVILYIMLSGYPPFDGKNNIEIFNKIQKIQFDYSKTIWNGVSDPAKDLINKLLCPSSKRISAKIS